MRKFVFSSLIFLSEQFYAHTIVIFHAKKPPVRPPHPGFQTRHVVFVKLHSAKFSSIVNSESRVHSAAGSGLPPSYDSPRSRCSAPARQLVASSTSREATSASGYHSFIWNHSRVKFFLKFDLDPKVYLPYRGCQEISLEEKTIAVI